MTAFDIAWMILIQLATTRECYGDLCRYCKYKTRCDMIHISLSMVIGGEYHG